MENLPWLDGYSGETTDELISLEGQYRTDSIVVVFEEAMGQKSATAEERGQSEESALTIAERTILVVETVERQVNNGGYNLFFENIGDEYTDVIEAAFRRIGCPKTADTARDAVCVIREFGYDTENEAKSERLDALDEQYFNSDEDIATCLFEYIKANRSEITTHS